MLFGIEGPCIIPESIVVSSSLERARYAFLTVRDWEIPARTEKHEGVRIVMVLKPFWKIKSLVEMTREEWESLCDGCGRCCLHKLEDEETGEVFYTSVACSFLDSKHCRCRCYEDRTRLVPNCLVLKPVTVARLYWLPDTCAYSRLAKGENLEWWHPLVSGNRDTVHRAGISVRDLAVPEAMVPSDRLEEYILQW